MKRVDSYMMPGYSKTDDVVFIRTTSLGEEIVFAVLLPVLLPVVVVILPVLVAYLQLGLHLFHLVAQSDKRGLGRKGIGPQGQGVA